MPYASYLIQAAGRIVKATNNCFIDVLGHIADADNKYRSYKDNNGW